MAIWDKSEPPASNNPPPSSQPAPASAPVASQPAKPATPPQPLRGDGKESFIASGLTIEGKIIGKGSVRVAGKFKGDIQVEGDLHIDREARVEGLLKAGEVVVNGELQGNIESAKRVELKQGSTMTGDLKAGSLTVEAGARMRGNVDFGFTETK
jgi:cytoskeletal protein CcmA (bactofilin family)